MDKLKVGSLAKMVGPCRCRETPMLQRSEDVPYPFHDIRDCYHRYSKIKRIFLDGVSVWLVNRYGFGTRVLTSQLEGGNI